VTRRSVSVLVARSHGFCKLLLMRLLLLAVACLLLGCCTNGCPATCDQQADRTWVSKLGLKTCQQANNLTLLAVLGQAQLATVAQQFNVSPLSAVEARCLLNNSVRHPYATADLLACVPLIAPAPEASQRDRLLGSMGLMADPSTGKLVSMCKPGMPCKGFNGFLTNGTLETDDLQCRMAAGETFFSAMGHVLSLFNVNDLKSFYKAAAMQKTATGMTDNCYCTFNDGSGVRGPMYGPIFYANAVFMYYLGGLELLGRMPGCRVLCQDACTNNCNPTIEIFN